MVIWSAMRQKITIGEFVRRNWLLVGILACIIAASLFPRLGIKGGPLKPEYTVKYFAVGLIFLISGLKLQSERICHTIKQFKLHLFVQGFTFVVIPLSMQMVVYAFRILGINPWLLRGFITVSCMPPPVSSAVILTRASHGNETAAIFNSILGSFLGILITPLALLLNLGFTTIIPSLEIIVQLVITVVVPLLIGQTVRNYMPVAFRGCHVHMGAVGQGALMLIIFCTFCETFHAPEESLTAGEILFTVFFVLLLQIAFLSISFNLAKRCVPMFDPADVIAIVFCATQKSLTMGIPILRIMFHGFSHLSQISLPLLVYHPTQIILGGLLVAHLKEWGQSTKRQRPPV